MQGQPVEFGGCTEDLEALSGVSQVSRAHQMRDAGLEGAGKGIEAGGSDGRGAKPDCGQQAV